MNYFDFIKHQLAGMYVVCDDGYLDIVQKPNGLFHVFSDALTDVSEFLTLCEIKYIVKLISECFGKSNFTYECWNRILKDAEHMSHAHEKDYSDSYH
jgi:hypothetical protein